MSRATLFAAAFLALLAGCRDGPHTITAPVDVAASLEAEALASRAALAALWEILDDPLVRELVEDSGLDERKFDRTAADMTAVHVRRDLGRLSDVVRFEDAEDTERQTDDEILRDVLDLILADATSVVASHFKHESSPAAHAGTR